MSINVFVPSCLRHGVSFVIFRTFCVAITLTKTNKLKISDGNFHYFRLMPKYVTDQGLRIRVSKEAHGVSCYCPSCTNNELTIARKYIKTY